MKEIKNKIKELLAIQNSEAYKDYDKLSEHMEMQEKLFDELTTLARKNKTIVGRILKFGVADGQAIYVIVKENLKTVKVQWINYCDGYFQYGLGGGQANLGMKQAIALCNFEDYMDNPKRK